MLDVGCSIFDIRCSILKSGSGETWARPKVTDNISAKDAVLPAVNEKCFILQTHVELHLSLLISLWQSAIIGNNIFSVTEYINYKLHLNT